MKYRFKDQQGNPIDFNVEDTWWRIANALGRDDAEQRGFYDALENYKFLPAGRIIAGAGTERRVTLFNCFVMGTIPDSMSGIFENLKEAALTMQQGGGIGYDFSTIRPKDAPVVHVGSEASGPLSFMDVWDKMCMTIMSAGTRRGAMMATMRCDHPDIYDFIHAKKNPTRLRKFNVSVLCTDDFMDAVENDEKIALWHEAPPPLEDGEDYEMHGKDSYVYGYESARDIWDAIMTSTYHQAEPGVIFIDRINNSNNLQYCETISATNPCGEQPLPPYGACLLGSINLTKMVTQPFTSMSEIDDDKLRRTVDMAIRMLDRVIDVSNFPLTKQSQEAEAKRRVGLGITGLADALVMLGKKYGSPQAITFVDQVMRSITNQAYLTSAEIAKEEGSFPLYDAEKFQEGVMFKRLDAFTQDAIKKHGIRNSHLISIAPTGTISLFAGNVSSGIEPIFALSYNRKVLDKDGTHIEEEVIDYAFEQFRMHYPSKSTPAEFVTAQTLEPLDHLRMQAAAQPWVDSSISKTINLPEDISYDDFKDVYNVAFDSGCKGCTTYRPNAITGSILSVSSEEKTPDDTEIELEERPDELDGQTYKIKIADGHAHYVTITDKDGRPFEIFVNTKDPQAHAWVTALTRMISAVFRRPHDSTFVVEELKAVFDPAGGGWWNGKYYHSMVAAIGAVVERHMVSIGYIGETDKFVSQRPTENPAGEQCPKCFEFAMVMKEGCKTCSSCGHSECN